MKKTVISITVIFLAVMLTALPAAAVTVIDEDFDSAYPGDDPLSLNALYGYFEWENATPDSSCEIVPRGDGAEMKLSGYCDLRTIDYIPAEYVFSLDIQIPKPSNMINIFVRGEMPGAMQKKNPRNRDVMQTFYYYEWDWYKENGGNGGSYPGGSGLAICPNESRVDLIVKKYAPDSLTVASDRYYVDYPGNVDVKEHINIKVTDDGRRMNVYMNGSLTAYLELSAEKTSYESDGTNVDYYKRAEVFDASGKSLGATENTRLHYDGSQLAVGTRNETAFIDEFKIYYGDGAIEAFESGKLPETTEQTTTAEEITETGKTTEEQTTAEQTTAEPQTTEGSVTATEKAEPEPGNGVNKTAVIIIAAIVDVIIIAALAIFIPKKKK